MQTKGSGDEEMTMNKRQEWSTKEKQIIQLTAQRFDH